MNTLLKILDNIPNWSVGHEKFVEEALDMLNLNVHGHNNYPPHNLTKKSDSEYSITMAVAGFSKDDLTIKGEGNALSVEGKKHSDEVDNNFIYKGISDRQFNKQFLLSENTFVKDVNLTDGLLEIKLERIIPEDKKETVYQIN